MTTVDVIIELLETGKSMYTHRMSSLETGSIEEGRDNGIQRIIELINQMVGNDRSETIRAFFEKKINLQNAILRLVVDEPKEPLSPLPIPKRYFISGYNQRSSAERQYAAGER